MTFERKIDEGRACGEPLRSQLVVVDFKLKPEDTLEVQEKCCQFWDVVNTKPELEVATHVVSMECIWQVPYLVNKYSTFTKEVLIKIGSMLIWTNLDF